MLSVAKHLQYGIEQMQILRFAQDDIAVDFFGSCWRMRGTRYETADGK